MARFEDTNSSERNKLIAAIVLGAVALLSVGYLIFGSSSTPARQTNSNNAVARNSPLQRQVTTPDQVRSEIALQPIDANFRVPPSSDVGRNIFGFYLAPTPVPTVAKPSPTAPPAPPPILLATISPQNVYARTGDFTLDVTGDKFAPGLQIYINENQIPTRFVSAQQLSAKVPGPMIAGEGQQQVVVRSADGKLFSNSATLVVQAPPVPNFNYIGIFETRRMVDTAVLEDKGTKTQVNVQRGDVVGGRFRVTSISVREVVLTDTGLRIKHTLPLTGDAGKTSPIVGQPRPQNPDSDDDDASP